MLSHVGLVNRCSLTDSHEVPDSHLLAFLFLAFLLLLFLLLIILFLLLPVSSCEVKQRLLGSATATIIATSTTAVTT